MTNYTVLVYEKGTDGFRTVGTADANTPKQAIEMVLGDGKSVSQGSEGTAAATPTRSFYTQPYKLAMQPKLELG